MNRPNLSFNSKILLLFLFILLGVTITSSFASYKETKGLNGNYNTPGLALGVYVQGNYAYVADWTKGLHIINVTDPMTPTFAGSLDTPGLAEGVHVQGNYAYVADRTSGLQIIDVTTPTVPVLVGTYPTPDCAEGVHVQGNYAYVADRVSGLQIIDVTDPTSPTFAATYNTPHWARNVHVQGNYAYVADGRSGLQIIDVTNPTSPTLAATYNTPSFAHGIFVQDHYAYVADGYSGLQILNVTDPTAPTFVGNCDTPEFAYDVYVQGNYAYVADRVSGLQIIDVTNLAAPTLVGSYDTEDWAFSVHVQGSYAYVAAKRSGLYIINLGRQFIYVPTDYPTIQEAIDVAIPGCTVIVLPTYSSSQSGESFPITLKDGVHLISSDGPSVTIIDAQSQAVGLQIGSVIEPMEIKGFTLENAQIGIAADDVQLIIKNNIIRHCSDTCIEAVGRYDGAGTLNIVNNTLDDCQTGIDVFGENTMVVQNNIINNSVTGIQGSLVNMGNYVSGYNNFYNVGSNIDFPEGPEDLYEDPRFINITSGNYRLWPDSFSIDSGNPSDDYSQEPQPNGGRIDIGAYGNTPLATACGPFICGDMNESGGVEIGDVTYLISYLYQGGPPPMPLEKGDVNSSGEVSSGDVTYLINYLYQGGPPPVCPYFTKRQEALDWVSQQRVRDDVTYNWVAVTETATYGYTYDNALAIIAYTSLGDLESAEELLGFLSQYQLPDGSFYDSMFQADGTPHNTTRSSGNQAWALYAIAFYTHQTGDTTYLSMGDAIANWLIARQDPADGGITGGINSNGSERPWTSTEHNIGAYFAFKLYSVVTGNSLYLDVANLCKEWLLNVGWNATEKRFNTGENDPSEFLDAQSLGSIFLNDMGDFEKRDDLLKYVYQDFHTKKTFSSGGVSQTYSGYKYAPDDGSFWWEGTEQVAFAYGRAGSRNRELYYINQILMSDDPDRLGSDNDGDGGFQYAMEPGPYGLGTLEQPSPGLWLIFAINDYLGDYPIPFYPVQPPLHQPEEKAL